MKHIKKFNQLNEATKGPRHKDTPKAIDKWWQENYDALIDYVAGIGNKDLADLFKLGGLTKSEVEAELDGTAKHKAISVLNIFGIEYCNSLISEEEED